MKKPLFVIMAGDGINCERETAQALQHAGATAEIIHINDLLVMPEKLKTADGLAIPGGFSFGDELGSGQIMALKIRHKLGEAFFGMMKAQKPIIGICNGFQVLMKLGLLPFPNEPERIATLASNKHGRFMNQWVNLKAEDSVCLWTIGLGKTHIELPIRHGEGRIVFKKGEEEKIYKILLRQKQIPLTYTEDVNGSYGRIAALTDPSGIVLGLMPHPEAFINGATYKQPNTRTDGDGALIFRNIIRVLNGKETEYERRTA